MVLDGSLIAQLVVQTPIVALLVVFIVLERRDHARTLAIMRKQIEDLEHALIDHMNRLAE